MRTWSWLLLATMLVTTSGCGGCSGGSPLSQMKRRAIPNVDDDEDAAPPPKPRGSDEATPSAVKPAEGVAATVTPATAPANTLPMNTPAAPTITAPVVVQGKTIPIEESVEHLRKISVALEAYVAKHRMYPKVGNFVEDVQQPLLSWRVELLPYLGYPELHRKFDFSQPWDSPKNIKLLAEMPAEYRSLGAGDTRTNYLAVVGMDAAFLGVDQLLGTYKFTDGLSNCVVVVEVDNERAIPWTAPTEIPYAADKARTGLFGRRTEGTLAIVGGGAVHCIAPQATEADVAAMFSVKKGDSFDEQLLLPPSGAAVVAEPASPTPATEVAANNNIPQPTEQPNNNTPAPESEPETSKPASVALRPVPDAHAQKNGKKILAELYKADYERARTPQQKRELVAKLLPQAEEMSEDAVGHYLLLMLIHDIALGAGDIKSTAQTIDLLSSSYQVDRIAMQTKALESLGPALQNEADAKLLLRECEKLLQEVLLQDNFAAAQRTMDVAVVVAKRANSAPAQAYWVEMKKHVDEAKTAYTPVAAAQATLKTDPNNADANTVVGRYVCLYRRDWPTGLKSLARGGDIKLKVLAQIDLTNPSQSQQQVDLGDQWFALGADARPCAQTAFELRAAHWYTQALSSLPGGLIKSRVQKRLQDIAERTGDQSLQSFAANRRSLPVDE